MAGCAIALSLALSGCSDSGPRLVAVAGRVTLDGQPLATGSVTLRPDAAEGNWEQPTGSIEADGKYTIYTQRRPGAPPGKYRVVVFATAPTKDAKGAAHPGLPTSIVPEIFSDPARTPLEIEVDPVKKAAFDLELLSHVPQ